jgi:hypothetical protein
MIVLRPVLSTDGFLNLTLFHFRNGQGYLRIISYIVAGDHSVRIYEIMRNVSPSLLSAILLCLVFPTLCGLPVAGMEQAFD